MQKKFKKDNHSNVFSKTATPPSFKLYRMKLRLENYVSNTCAYKQNAYKTVAFLVYYEKEVIKYLTGTTSSFYFAKLTLIVAEQRAWTNCILKGP